MVRTIVLGGTEIKLRFERAFGPWRDIILNEYRVINWHTDDPDWAIAAAVLYHSVDIVARKNGDNITINAYEWILLKDKILRLIREFKAQCQTGGGNA